MSLILGIDPGSRVTGYGIINQLGSRSEYVTSGCIRTSSDLLPERLAQIFQGISTIIEQFSPQEVGVEQVFMARNADSALKLGQARGAAIVAAVNHGLAVSEYSARQVKQSVVGKGSAEKNQVQHMVQQLLHLNRCPPSDAADALAVALCHAHTQQSLIKIAGTRSVRRRRIR